MNGAEDAVVRLLDAYDGGDKRRIDLAWKPILDEARLPQAFELLRSALVLAAIATVPAELTDEQLESLASGIRGDTVDGTRFSEDLFFVTLLMARGDAEVAREVPDAILLVLTAATTAVLSKVGQMNRAELRKSAWEIAASR